jgi:hypothetical protein
MYVYPTHVEAHVDPSPQKPRTLWIYPPVAVAQWLRGLAQSWSVPYARLARWLLGFSLFLGPKAIRVLSPVANLPVPPSQKVPREILLSPCPTWWTVDKSKETASKRLLFTYILWEAACSCLPVSALKSPEELLAALSWPSPELAQQLPETIREQLFAHLRAVLEPFLPVSNPLVLYGIGLRLYLAQQLLTYRTSRKFGLCRHLQRHKPWTLTEALRAVGILAPPADSGGDEVADQVD